MCFRDDRLYPCLTRIASPERSTGGMAGLDSCLNRRAFPFEFVDDKTGCMAARGGVVRRQSHGLLSEVRWTCDKLSGIHSRTRSRSELLDLIPLTPHLMHPGLANAHTRPQLTTPTR